MDTSEESHVLDGADRESESRDDRGDAVILADVDIGWNPLHALAHDMTLLLVMHESRAWRERDARADLEAVLDVACESPAIAKFVVADDARPGVEVVAVDPAVVRLLVDVAHTKVELAVLVLSAEVRLGAVYVELAVAIAGRIAQVQRPSANARISEHA